MSISTFAFVPVVSASVVSGIVSSTLPGGVAVQTPVRCADELLLVYRSLNDMGCSITRTALVLLGADGYEHTYAQQGAAYKVPRF